MAAKMLYKPQDECKDASIHMASVSPVLKIKCYRETLGK